MADARCAARPPGAEGDAAPPRTLPAHHAPPRRQRPLFLWQRPALQEMPWPVAPARRGGTRNSGLLPRSGVAGGTLGSAEATDSAAFGFSARDLGHWNGGSWVGGRSSCRLGVEPQGPAAGHRQPQRVGSGSCLPPKHLQPNPRRMQHRLAGGRTGRGRRPPLPFGTLRGSPPHGIPQLWAGGGPERTSFRPSAVSAIGLTPDAEADRPLLTHRPVCPKRLRPVCLGIGWGCCH
jgi:hypothetical protein